MDIFSQYASNISLEEEGRQFDKEFGDATMLIARAGNRTYTRMIQAEYETYKHTLSQKSTPAERAAAEDCAEQIEIRVMSKSILLGWSGNVSYKVEPLPYSTENAAKLLALKEFRNKVAALSNNFQNYRLVTEEEDAKKSATSSSGSLTGEGILNSTAVSSVI